MIVTLVFCLLFGESSLSLLERLYVSLPPTILRQMVKQNVPIAHSNNISAFSLVMPHLHGLPFSLTPNYVTTIPPIQPLVSHPSSLCTTTIPIFLLIFFMVLLKDVMMLLNPSSTPIKSICDQTRDALTKAAEAMTRHSRSGPPAPFVVGDSVLVHRAAFRKHRDLHELKKFDDRWLGPFEIVKVVNANAYQLQLPPNFKKHNTINITFLHPYRQSQRFPRPHPDSVRPAAESYATSDDDDDGEYEVESILNHRIALSQHRHSSLRMTVAQQLQITNNPNDFEFLVKWKGYSMDENTWEPILHLEHAQEILRNYLTSKQLPIEWLHVFDNS